VSAFFDRFDRDLNRAMPCDHDGDAPFHPRGCIGQAWTVEEILRAWTNITEDSS
jgi:glycogen debranching enzyme